MSRETLHPIVEAAGRAGELPSWARCTPERYAHAERVAVLLEEWARELGHPPPERVRWRAAGYLHDALKDADPEELRALTDGEWPEPVLHAPACAEKLRAEGVEDDGLLLAIAYHPIGHPEFDELGEYLFLADFLEPGRGFLDEQRRVLRERLPGARREVLAEVLALRIHGLLRRRRKLVPAAIDLWNRVVEE